MSLISGNCLFRDTGDCHGDKKLFLVIGQLWVPASIALSTEHIYKLIGSEYHVHEPELMKEVGLQILLNSAKDVSSDTKKKDPARIIPLLHSSRP